MNLSAPPFFIATMTTADIPAVAAVEAKAYRSTIPPKDFVRELNNPLAHYFVLKTTTGPEEAVGVLGYWLIAGEAHIITIAVIPRWQKKGLGEWLLLNFFEDAHARAADTATLEVRPSNHKAIALYQKYGFLPVGRRPKYYPDTGEDALIFTTPPLNSTEMQTLLARYQQQLLPRLAQIRVDKSGQPG